MENNPTDPQTDKIPTREEIVQILGEQIEVKRLQVELQELNTRFADARLSELKSLSMIARITQPGQGEEGIPHTVTQEDVDNNPELAEQGIRVGDEVLLTSESVSEAESKPSAGKRGLKKV